MPLPTPQASESHDEFIERCMADPVMQEFDDESQRLAVCESQWGKAASQPESKSIHLELKEDGDTEGAFSAVFATLNVIDHHGDVTVPGAFENGKEVLVGAYQHEMWNLPVGKAVVKSDDDKAWIEGKFFTDTSHGLDTYQTVKNAGGLMEWSYIFQVKESDDGDFETDRGTVPVRFLKKLDVWSVDPVLKGAGLGTGTVSIKGFNGTTFTDHAEGIASEVDAFVARVKSRRDVRAKEGRTLSAANVDRLSAIAESLMATGKDLEQLLSDASPQKSNEPDLQKTWLEYQRTLAELQGVRVA